MKTRDLIYKALVQRYAAEDAGTLKEAAYNLALAGVTASTELVQADFWSRAEQAVSKIKQGKQTADTRILSEAAKKAYASSLSICPICKSKMNLVKLLEDRQAFYCTDHKICQPLPVEGE